MYIVKMTFKDTKQIAYVNKKMKADPLMRTCDIEYATMYRAYHKAKKVAKKVANGSRGKEVDIAILEFKIVINEEQENES